MTGLNDADKRLIAYRGFSGESLPWISWGRSVRQTHKGAAFRAKERLQGGRWAAGGGPDELGEQCFLK